MMIGFVGSCVDLGGYADSRRSMDITRVYGAVYYDRLIVGKLRCNGAPAAWA